MDSKTNGQLQKEWGWLIAAYLFLGGVGSGAYVIAALNSFFGSELEMSTVVGLWIGCPALIIGSLCLLADLGHPERAVRAGLKIKTSWIARGFWIISAFIMLSGLHLILQMTGAGSTGLVQFIAVLGIIFAISTMAYTGLLLGASKGITFWCTGTVPVLFVVSALVTGHFSIMLGLTLFVDNIPSAALTVMGYEALALVVAEILAILFYLNDAFRFPDAKESATRLLHNRLFVLGYILLGLIAPLILMVVMIGASNGILTLAVTGGLLGLLGGLILRWAVLISGTMPTWNIAGFQFHRHPRPQEPKPGVGMLPPE